MNLRAILVSVVIFLIVGFAVSDEGLAIAAFLLSALVFHIKPELLGNLNKPKEEAENEEDQQQSDSPS